MPATSTEALAAGLNLKPQTLRAAFCRHGHYFGIRPTKLPNGRLLWPADAIERLTSGTAGEKPATAAAKPATEGERCAS